MKTGVVAFVDIMATQADKLVSEIRALPDEEKLRVLDAILTELDKPDHELDYIWAVEARKRWISYKSGRLPSVSYELPEPRLSQQSSSLL